MIKKILIGICVLVTIYVAYIIITARTLQKAEQKGLITFNAK